jgi:hypothetical protein
MRLRRRSIRDAWLRFGYLGVQTTSFAALIAGAGLAIGAAWSGLLAHFAAGLFMRVLRPFKVGDYVFAGGIEGTVREMGLFGTTIITPDNVVTIVGNNRTRSERPRRRSSAESHCCAVGTPAACNVVLRARTAHVPESPFDLPKSGQRD